MKSLFVAGMALLLMAQAAPPARIADRLVACLAEEPLGREVVDRLVVRGDHRPPHDLEIDLVLVLEVPVERADRDAGLFCDLGRTDRVIAVLAKQRLGGIEQCLVAPS